MIPQSRSYRTDLQTSHPTLGGTFGFDLGLAPLQAQAARVIGEDGYPTTTLTGRGGGGGGGGGVGGGGLGGGGLELPEPTPGETTK